MLTMKPTKLIIFDCDGTLIDSERINSQATSETLLALGHSKFTLEYCLEYFAGCSAQTVITTLKDLKIPDPDLMLRSLCARAVELSRAQLTTIPKAAQLINKINLPKCIASNGERFVVLEALKIVGLNKFFVDCHVFTAESVEKAKPAPDLYLHTALKMGNIDPENCLVIEDSVVGVTAAKAANMAVLGFVGGKHHGKNAKTKLLDAGAFTTVDNLLDVLSFIRT